MSFLLSCSLRPRVLGSPPTTVPLPSSGSPGPMAWCVHPSCYFFVVMWSDSDKYFYRVYLGFGVEFFCILLFSPSSRPREFAGTHSVRATSCTTEPMCPLFSHCVTDVRFLWFRFSATSSSARDIRSGGTFILMSWIPEGGLLGEGCVVSLTRGIIRYIVSLTRGIIRLLSKGSITSHFHQQWAGFLFLFP